MSSSTFELITKGLRCVRAGAGAGKTTALVDAVLKALQEKPDRQKVMVCTFTVKATEELRERIVKRALSVNNQELLELAMSEDHLEISTIHGILYRFLRREGERLGLPPKMQFVSWSEEIQLARQLFFENPHWHTHVSRALSLRQQISHLVNLSRFYLEKSSLGFPSLEDLHRYRAEKSQSLLRFRNEIARRVYEQGDNKGWRDWAETCLAGHQVYWPSLPRYTPKSGIDTDTKDQLRNCYKEFDDLNAEDWSEETLISYCQQIGHYEQVTHEFIPEFIKRKIWLGRISLSDLEGLSHYLISRSETVAKEYSSRIFQWFVDEFQDTSPLQVELISALSQGCKHYIVGDPQQSIYLFRGARVEVFTKMEQTTLRLGGELEKKLVNYRSAPPVLDFVNVALGNWQNFLPMTTGKEVADRLDRVSFQPFETEEEELNGLVDAIQKFGDADVAVLVRNNADVIKVSQILDRAGLAVAADTDKGFLERTEVFDFLSLVKIMINPFDDEALLRVLRGFGSAQLIESLGGVAVRPSSTTKPSEVGLWRALGLTGSAEAQSWLERIQAWQSLAKGATVVHALETALLELRFFERVRGQDPSGVSEANVHALLENFRASGKRPGFSAFAWLQGLKPNRMGLSPEDSSLKSSPSHLSTKGVKVMTIHKSKGLEFDVVFLPFLESQMSNSTFEFKEIEFDETRGLISLPFLRSQKTFHHPYFDTWKEEKKKRLADENLRLLYVALTRAKQFLVLTCTHDQDKPAPKGSFLSHLAPALGGLPPLAGLEQLDLRKANSPGISTVHRVDLSNWAQSRSMSEAKLPTSEAGRVAKKRVSVSKLLQELASASAPNTFDPGLEKKIDVYKSAKRIADGVRTHQELEELESYRAQVLEKILSADPKLIPWRQCQDWRCELGILFKARTGETVEGKIDLLGLDLAAGQALLIDYKTGQSLFVDKAFQQLNLYAEAVQKIWPNLNSIARVVYYLSENRVVF